MVRLLLFPDQPVVTNFSCLVCCWRCCSGCYHFLLLFNNILGKTNLTPLLTNKNRNTSADYDVIVFFQRKSQPAGLNLPLISLGTFDLFCVREVSPRHQRVWPGVSRPCQRPRQPVPSQQRPHRLPAVAISSQPGSIGGVSTPNLLKD